MSIEEIYSLELSIGNLLRLQELRKRLFTRILEMCDYGREHHKSYEGHLELILQLPNVWENEETSPCWGLRLFCYLLCSGREELFEGDTVPEVLDKFEKWLNHLSGETMK